MEKGVTQGTMRHVALDVIKEYAGEDADVTLQLNHILSKDIEKENLRTLIDTMELPLITVLRDIEYEGVRIDPEFLRNYSKVLEEQIRTSEKAIYEKCGTRFNIASPKQVGEVLFDKLKIPYRWKKQDQISIPQTMKNLLNFQRNLKWFTISKSIENWLN